MEKITINVSGMGCAGCEETVEGAVRAACPEATEVKADHGAGNVSYACSSPERRDAVEEAVRAAGYAVVA